MSGDEWQAEWIGLDRTFEGDVMDNSSSRLSARYFTSERKPAKATLYISGLWLYELFVNGTKIGDQVLSPIPTYCWKGT